MLERYRDRCRRSEYGGFTLVEFLVVLVIAGIVAAVATPRFFVDRTFLERGYYEELAAGLRYAQRLAVASGCPVRMQIHATGYAARHHAAADEPCARTRKSWEASSNNADGLLLTGAAPAGVAISRDVTITFDALGRPDVAADQVIAIGAFALTLKAGSGHLQTP